MLSKKFKNKIKWDRGDTFLRYLRIAHADIRVYLHLRPYASATIRICDHSHARPSASATNRIRKNSHPNNYYNMYVFIFLINN